ncbi:GNAT family N-acetyltransferase [Streptomyces sp. B1866]|uniref:GNAT family N-acetyltransferase n=1 Tax=Streptomyces sp. B1866 TaxID=3075431 RepID=UPI00288FE7D3|nr:GNAT family N-acetyltransferase [Streptomyces sp. B1866]MDT3395308.1 GNAT family N-acetyltransferase [Streptomyces sp. B1866]
MYQMRPASERDLTAMGELIDARMRWMSTQGIPITEGPLATTLVGQREDDRRPLVWVLVEDGRLIGCTVLLNNTQGWGWADEQRAEPALTMLSTYTHPAFRHDRPARLMAWWILDFAAHLGRPRWVRRAVPGEKLMRHYRDTHRWNLVDTVLRNGRRAYLMQRTSEKMTGINALVGPPATRYLAQKAGRKKARRPAEAPKA